VVVREGVENIRKYCIMWGCATKGMIFFFFLCGGGGGGSNRCLSPDSTILHR